MQVQDYTAEFLQGLEFFSGLPGEDLAALAGASVLRTYPRGQSVFHLGDKADRFFVVQSGWLKLYRMTEEGEEIIIALFTRGDVFGEAAIFSNMNYPFAAMAAEEAALVEIPAEVLRQRARRNPAITERAMHSMSREMNRLRMENEHMAIMSAPQRVGCLLLQLTATMRGTGGNFTFPYAKALAAARLGMKPETFSRALGQLKATGVQSRLDDVAIADFERLAAFSCASCTAACGDCPGAFRKFASRAITRAAAAAPEARI